MTDETETQETPKPKRFYESAKPEQIPGGWTVELDGRSIKTPARVALKLPTEKLAKAVAAEWNAQDAEIDLMSMHLTRLANVAIDRVPETRYEMADELARYCIIGAAMLGMGAVWIEGAHMRVAILENRVPAPIKRVIVWYQWLLTLALTGAMTWFSYEYVGSVGFFKTPGLQISRSIPVAILPVGFGLLFLLALLNGPKPMRAQTVEDDE